MTLQLWSIVRNAFGDQPDLVELAETLSQNFESLYENEVHTSWSLYFSLSRSCYCALNCCLSAYLVIAVLIYNW